MTELLEVIKERARNLGYDFNELSREEQDKVINLILSYAENVFRGMADYPDDRFGRRRGIYKNSFAGSNQGGGNSEANSQTNTDINCNLEERRSVGDERSCSENDNKTCDNGCSNNNTEDCRDAANCVDNECQNLGFQSCIDETNCSDTGCNNSTGNSPDEGCIDNDNCSDINGCNNNPPIGSHCTDYDSCTDTGCKNQSTMAQSCVDATGCKDDMCCNRKCEDGGNLSSQCKDDLCANGQDCSDIASRGVFCKDIACSNSVLCTDANCSDKPCSNYSQECFDQVGGEITCRDESCKNYCGDFDPQRCGVIPPDPWVDSIISCQTSKNIDTFEQRSNLVAQTNETCGYDNVCANWPQCNDSPNPGCAWDRDNLCSDSSSGGCTNGAVVSPYPCQDLGCTNDKNCLDKNVCYDSKYGNIFCTDDECKNSGGATGNAYCVDWDNCLDKGGCTNDDFCQDEGSCTDGNTISTCINGKCVNASTSGCVDVEGKCINIKCIDLKKVVDDQNPAQCTDNRCDP